MFFQKPVTSTVQEMLDKYRVQELIEYERFCRDNALWDQMHACFAQDSTVTISWYQGSGHGFVEASKNMTTKAPHKLNNTLVWLNRDRAAAVTMACIQTRTLVDGANYDMTSYVRFIYTAQKAGDEWKVVSMNCIYEKDCLIPSSPAGQEVPAGLRESYGNLSMTLANQGRPIDGNLPGDDRPELTDELVKRASAWLENA